VGLAKAVVDELFGRGDADLHGPLVDDDVDQAGGTGGGGTGTSTGGEQDDRDDGDGPPP